MVIDAEALGLRAITLVFNIHDPLIWFRRVRYVKSCSYLSVISNIQSGLTRSSRHCHCCAGQLSAALCRSAVLQGPRYEARVRQYQRMAEVILQQFKAAEARECHMFVAFHAVMCVS